MPQEAIYLNLVLNYKMSKTIKVTSQNFKEEVLDSKIPVLIDFWVPWCQPCIIMAPAMDELSEELDDRLKIGKLNIKLPEAYGQKKFLETNWKRR